MSDITNKIFTVDGLINRRSYASEEQNGRKNLEFMLKKFKKSDISCIVFEACNLSYDKSSNKKLTKDNLVRHIIDQLKIKNFDFEQVAAILLIKYMQNYPESKTWSGVLITDAESLWEPHVTSEKFSKVVIKFMKRNDSPCKVFSEKNGDSMWTVLAFDDNLKTYGILVTYAQRPLVLYCNLKASNTKHMQKVFQQAFRGKGIQKLEFKSKYLNTVAHHGLKKCKDLVKDAVPISLPTKKRKVEEKPRLPLNVISQNIDEERLVDKYLQKEFSEYELPAVEKLTYNIKSNCFSFDDEDFSFQSHVTFKGNNVLEGLHKLVKTGIAEAPLPSYILQEPNAGQTTFTLKIEKNMHKKP